MHCSRGRPLGEAVFAVRHGWLALKPLVLALATMGLVQAAPPSPGQLPTGGQVVAGNAAIATAGTAMTVTQSSQRAIVDWSTFNVGSAAAVHFKQLQGAGSVTLNRVLDSNPSQIYGRISAPGQVFFTNPHGMYFAPGASVDVGGLVATTHRISNENFMAGRYLFERNGASGSIINEGELKASLGGYIALLAPEVRNRGVVLAQMGTVALAAGEAYELQIQGQNTLANVLVEPATINALVDNGHLVQAEDGLIILSARAADQLQGGVVRNSGSLIASSLVEKGGRILLTADDITLTSTSRLDASGATGGGTVLVGGDWQGSGEMYQASRVSMASGARIDASATQNGDGGKVVLWSKVSNPDSLTSVHGEILARGGALGGNGGRIETSGHVLDVAGVSGSASAPFGRAGEWLFDPYDITISSGANANGAFSGGTWAGSGAVASSTILNSDINTLLNAGTSVIISTAGASGTGTGNITVANNISKTSGADTSLSLVASNNIVLNAGVGITSTVGKLNVVVNSDSDASGSGSIKLNAGASIVTNGGNLTLGGGANPATGYAVGSVSGEAGVNLDRATLNAAAGNIVINGRGHASGGNGLKFFGNSTATGGGTVFTPITTTTGNITVNAEGFGSGAGGNGIYIQHTNVGMTSTSGNIALTVANGFNMLLSNGPAAAPIISTGGNGTLSLQVTGDLSINASSFSTVDGAMSVAATGGLGTVWGGSFRATGLGSIALTAGGTISLGHSSGYVQTNTGALSLTASDLSLVSVDTLRGAGSLLLQPALASSTIGLGTGATGSFSLDSTEFGYIKNGFSQITVGRSDGTGAMDVRALTVNDPLLLRVPGTGGNIALNGALAMGSNALTLTAGGDVTGAGSISLNTADLTVDVGGTGGAGFSGTIVGSTNFLKAGSGTFILSGSNTAFTGGATVNSGTLKVSSSANALGTTAGGTTVASGATLWFDGVNISENISLAGTGSGSAGALVVSNAVTLGGTLTVADNASVRGDQSGTDSLNVSAVSLAAGKSLTLGGGETLDLTVGAVSAADTSTALAVNTLGTLSLGAVGTTSNRIGSVNIASGVSTLNGIASVATIAASSSGNLTVAGDVSTTDTSTSAIVLNAGKTAAAGTSTGGNLIISSGTISTGTGGRATLYSGALSDTSLATLVGSGTGRFRYNSDEVASNFTAALGSGLFAIYRERPVLALTPGAVTMSYGGSVPTVTNGYTGYVNGDTTASDVISGTATWTIGGAQSAAGHYLVGTHDLTYVSGLASALGYGLSNNAGSTNELTINKAALTVTANGVSKTYDGQAYSGGNGVAYSGLAAGESSSVLGGTLAYGGTSQGAVNAGDYAISPQGLTSSNYQISFVDGKLAISPKQPVVQTTTTAPAAASTTPDPASGSSQASASLQQTMVADTTSAGGTTSSPAAAPSSSADTTPQAAPASESKAADTKTTDTKTADTKTADGNSTETKETDSKDSKKDAKKDEKSDAAGGSKKAKVLDGLMVRPPAVPGFKRAYIVLLENADGSTGKIIISGKKGEQVVDSAGFGVPLDGSALPQKVSPDLMKQDFAGAQKAQPKASGR